jgi:hypothetical protein
MGCVTRSEGMAALCALRIALIGPALYAALAGAILERKGKPWVAGAVLGSVAGPLGVIMALPVAYSNRGSGAYPPRQRPIDDARTACRSAAQSVHHRAPSARSRAGTAARGSMPYR